LQFQGFLCTTHSHGKQTINFQNKLYWQ